MAKNRKNANFKTKMFLKIASFDRKCPQNTAFDEKQPKNTNFDWKKCKICITDPIIKKFNFRCWKYVPGHTFEPGA